GRTKALDAAHALLGTAKTIRIVRLRDLPEKGDVSDWLDADTRNAGKFADVCFDTPLWTSDSPPPSSAPAITLQWIDMSNWGREPIPERQWIIRDRVPIKQGGLFSGEGGAGKSIIQLTKDVAHAIGRTSLGGRSACRACVGGLATDCARAA